jgi:ketosteroid isomerase-like protein
MKGEAMDSQANKDVVRRLDELTHGGDLRQLDALCTPDMINHSLAPGRPSGIEGTRQFLASPGRSKMAGRWVSSIVVAEGDFVVQFGVRAGECDGASFRGFSLPPGSYTRDAAFMFRLVDGRIAERWAVRDDLGMMLQLGALTPGERR